MWKKALSQGNREIACFVQNPQTLKLQCDKEEKTAHVGEAAKEEC